MVISPHHTASGIARLNKIYVGARVLAATYKCPGVTGVNGEVGEDLKSRDIYVGDEGQT